MKKLILSIAGLIALSIGSTAQTITIDQLTPQIGDFYTQGMGAYVSPGAPGANQTWDLSGLTNSQTATVTIVDPAGLPGATNFPSASFAMVNDAQMLYGYSAILDDRIELVGIYQGGVVMDYPNPQTQLQFPLSYQTTYSDNYERIVDFSGYENHEIGVLSVVVDGYGTLITPAGTFTNVLRLKEEVVAEVILTIDGEFDSTEPLTSTTYVYVKAGYTFSLASLIESEFTGNITKAGYYLMDSSVGLDELSPVSNLTVFPVPMEIDFTLNMDLETAADVSFNLFAVDGRMVAQLGKGSFPAGGNTHSLSLPANTASGIYLLQIQTPESTLTRKIVVQ